MYGLVIHISTNVGMSKSVWNSSYTFAMVSDTLSGICVVTVPQTQQFVYCVWLHNVGDS